MVWIDNDGVTLEYSRSRACIQRKRLDRRPFHLLSVPKIIWPFLDLSVVGQSHAELIIFFDCVSDILEVGSPQSQPERRVKVRDSTIQTNAKNTDVIITVSHQITTFAGLAPVLVNVRALLRGLS